MPFSSGSSNPNGVAPQWTYSPHWRPPETLAAESTHYYVTAKSTTLTSNSPRKQLESPHLPL
jgi:hypothetical protein